MNMPNSEITYRLNKALLKERQEQARQARLILQLQDNQRESLSKRISALFDRVNAYIRPIKIQKNQPAAKRAAVMPEGSI